MYSQAALPTQAMVVAGLSSVINDVCCGAYAITKQCTDDGDLVFDSVKPVDVPRIIRMGAEPGRSSYIRTMGSRGKRTVRKSPFFKEVQVVQGISDRAKRFAKGVRKGEKEIRKTAISLAVRADNAADAAWCMVEPDKRAETFGISAHSAVTSGMLFSMLGSSEDIVSAQKALTVGAQHLSRIGMPIAGATAQASAVAMSQPWNRMDDRTREMKKEAGRMWAQSLQIWDQVSELDRVFLGLISAPKNEYVRLLLIKLIHMHEQNSNWMCMAADYLRLALAVAKSENPNHDDWLVVRTCVDRALKIWWVLHRNREIDIGEMMPEVTTAEEIALWAGALEVFGRDQANLPGLAARYTPVIAQKNDEHEMGRLTTELERERFIEQYNPQGV
jgi:hypothetical protein